MDTVKGMWLVKFVPDIGSPVAGSGRTLDAAFTDLANALTQAAEEARAISGEAVTAAQHLNRTLGMRDA